MKRTTYKHSVQLIEHTGQLVCMYILHDLNKDRKWTGLPAADVKRGQALKIGPGECHIQLDRGEF